MALLLLYCTHITSSLIVGINIFLQKILLYMQIFLPLFFKTYILVNVYIVGNIYIKYNTIIYITSEGRIFYRLGQACTGQYIKQQDY